MMDKFLKPKLTNEDITKFAKNTHKNFRFDTFISIIYNNLN